MKSKTLYCSFCGKSQHEVTKLIKGPGSTCICNECVYLCIGILDGKTAEDTEHESWMQTLKEQQHA